METTDNLEQQKRDLIEAVRALRHEQGRLVAYALDRGNDSRRKEWAEANCEASRAIAKVWHLL